MIIIVALALSLVCMPVLSLEIDGAAALHERDRLQMAVDASALAGALDLCSDDPTGAEQVAHEYGAMNGFDHVDATVYDGSLHVSATVESPRFVLWSTKVSAKAAAAGCPSPELVE
jgi:uncharacterized membrane protein